MNSLRARIAAVLVASIACVVFLATITTMLVVHEQAANTFIEPIARQLEFVIRLAAADPAAFEKTGLISPDPAAGAQDQHLTQLLQDALAKKADNRRIAVSRQAGSTAPIVSVELAQGRWLAAPIAEEPQPPLLVLGAWMLLIVVGAAGVSLIAAHRLTRPLALLDTVADDIGPEGQLQPIPETGPAEVRATARALNRMNKNLQRAVDGRMRLVAAAGHDLRTPMTRMRLRAEFLDDADRQDWLRDLDELDRIADSAIRLVREEVENRDSEIVRLDTLAQSITSELADMNLAVAVGAAAPLCITGAPLALTRAFRNLIINAAVHGGGAVIGVEARDGRAVMVIEDRGPGIPEHLLDRVFEPFFRVDPSRRQSAPGAGLGLAIAREIIARAGGELLISNRTGGGLRQEAAFPLRLDPQS